MKSLEKLLARIIQRVNINLREIDIDINPLVPYLIPPEKMTQFYAFYGITPHHPLNFQFKNSNLAGSYFLGKCRVTNSLLYKSDIRGDELKAKGDLFQYQKFEIPVNENEEIHIEDSFLIKTLIHNFSHDPETLEKFFVKDTIALHHANIHGSPTEGCFLGPFSTVDLTTVHDCFIGAFSYVQAEEISHLSVDPGTIWVRCSDEFNFLYRYPLAQLKPYVWFGEAGPLRGALIDFVDSRKEDFQKVFNVINIEKSLPVPDNASLNRFSVVKPHTQISENVLVAQRAYVQNSFLGKGANAQESCYIINSRLEGFDISAHGAKIIDSELGKNVFVGFNSFLRGTPAARLTIGQESIVMPHTIIDIHRPLTIPPGHLVWGLVKDEKDLQQNSMSLKDFSKADPILSKGNLLFEGSGKSFISSFRDRIHHILQANGAFFDGRKNKGHAQQNQSMSFNTLQPYPEGDKEGLFPTIIIQP